jgi:hypothetical protein
VHVASNGGTTTVLLTAGVGDGRSQDTLWSHTGIATGGTWTQVLPPGGTGGFGIVAVDPNDPDRILASHLRAGVAPQMVLSTDGGATWTTLTALDTLMTGAGSFRYQTTTGLAHSGNAITQRIGTRNRRSWPSIHSTAT